MTDDPKLTLLHLVENAQQALVNLDTAIQRHGPDSIMTTYYDLLYNDAHRELMDAMTELREERTNSEVLAGTPIPPTPVPPRELATTQWVQEYVAKHLPTTRSWFLTDLLITVLSGILGGLIVILLGAALLLLLP